MPKRFPISDRELLGGFYIHYRKGIIGTTPPHKNEDFLKHLMQLNKSENSPFVMLR